MKKYLITLMLIMVLFLCGCSISNDDGQGAITINYESINLCNKPMDETFTWQNFQIQSTGWSDLTITNIEVRGDANCAFQVYRPAANGESPDQIYLCPGEAESSPSFKLKIAPGSVQILKIDYTPSALGVLDRADLIISSNAGRRLVIPMCGVGIALQQSEPESPLDGGADASADSGTDVDVDTDSDSGTIGCTECGDPLEVGAPECTQES
jgi:hypothetical protein